MWRTLKAIILWNYSRTTWQYDVLCVLILAFIFLTPPSWFDNNEGRIRRYLQGQPVAERVLLSTDQLSPEASKEEIEKRVRSLTGRPNAEVTAFRPIQDSQGKTTAFEVDIR
jgi:hypothetical protein